MKTEILPKSIPKRAAWSDIQRKKAFIILPSIETTLRKVWPLLKRLGKGKIHKFTSKIMRFLESVFSFLIEAKLNVENDRLQMQMQSYNYAF